MTKKWINPGSNTHPQRHTAINLPRHLWCFSKTHDPQEAESGLKTLLLDLPRVSLGACGSGYGVGLLVAAIAATSDLLLVRLCSCYWAYLIWLLKSRFFHFLLAFLSQCVRLLCLHFVHKGTDAKACSNPSYKNKPYQVLWIEGTWVGFRKNAQQKCKMCVSTLLSVSLVLRYVQMISVFWSASMATWKQWQNPRAARACQSHKF